MTFLERLDALRASINVLDHPFYRRWTEGELTREELAHYAGEYRHAVVALADAVDATAQAAEPAIRAQLEEHAGEEAAHVGLWDSFAGAVGAPTDATPEPETVRCRDAWTAGSGLLEGLVVLYAIEAGQPAVSQTKLEGLVAHYGLDAEGPATEYFRLHAALDHEHAAESRALLAERVAPGDEDALLELAEGALRGNWELLDGVERRFGR